MSLAGPVQYTGTLCLLINPEWQWGNRGWSKLGIIKYSVNTSSALSWACLIYSPRFIGKKKKQEYEELFLQFIYSRHGAVHYRGAGTGALINEEKTGGQAELAGILMTKSVLDPERKTSASRIRSRNTVVEEAEWDNDAPVLHYNTNHVSPPGQVFRRSQ